MNSTGGGIHLSFPSHNECMRGDPARVLANTAGTNSLISTQFRTTQTNRVRMYPGIPIKKTEFQKNFDYIGYKTASSLTTILKGSTKPVNQISVKLKNILPQPNLHLVSTAKSSTTFKSIEHPRIVNSGIGISRLTSLGPKNDNKDYSFPYEIRNFLWSAEGNHYTSNKEIDYVQYYQDYRDKYGIG